MKKIKILSIDGGGIRGVIPVCFLMMASQHVPFLDQIDVFTGTSTGSLIALALSAGKSPEELLTLYEGVGSAIFTKKNPEYPQKRAKYDLEDFKTVLSTVFPPNLSLDALTKKVVIPTFDLKTWTPTFHHNFEQPCQSSILDVAVSSCSAPFYFPSHQIQIDGGVCANHPGLVSALLASKYFKAPLDQIELLSFGTGKLPDHQNHEVNYGLNEWMNPQPKEVTVSPFPFFTLSTQATTQMADFYLTHLLNNRYFRLNPLLEKSVAIDDLESVNYLKEVALLYPKEHPNTWNALITWIQKSFLT